MPTYEVDLICPECVNRIKLYAKNVACMGNADLVPIKCHKCGLEFYILESDYDRMRRLYE